MRSYRLQVKVGKHAEGMLKSCTAPSWAVVQAGLVALSRLEAKPRNEIILGQLVEDSGDLWGDARQYSERFYAEARASGLSESASSEIAARAEKRVVIKGRLAKRAGAEALAGGMDVVRAAKVAKRVGARMDAVIMGLEPKDEETL